MLGSLVRRSLRNWHSDGIQNRPHPFLAHFKSIPPAPKRKPKRNAVQTVLAMVSACVGRYPPMPRSALR